MERRRTVRRHESSPALPSRGESISSPSAWDGTAVGEVEDSFGNDHEKGRTERKLRKAYSANDAPALASKLTRVPFVGARRFSV